MTKLKFSNIKVTHLRSPIWKTTTDNQINLDLNPKPKGFHTQRKDGLCTNVALYFVPSPK